MLIYRHFAWFHRHTGLWLAEWRGDIPSHGIPHSVVGDERIRRLNAWQQHWVQRLGECETLDEVREAERWDACRPGEAVCLDVTQFGWPIGDHIWHVWNDTDRRIDWPESSTHLFVEVDVPTLRVVANQRSHRPIRDAVVGQHVIDITGTPWAAYHGQIWGRFVWRKDEQRWGFEPQQAAPMSRWRRLFGQPAPQTVSPAVRLSLMEAPVVFDVLPVVEREKARMSA